MNLSLHSEEMYGCYEAVQDIVSTTEIRSNHAPAMLNCSASKPSTEEKQKSRSGFKVPCTCSVPCYH